MDGSTALEFVQTTDGYKTTETVGALTITTNYNTAFEKVGTSIERKYEDVKALDAMSSKFQSAWSDVQSYLPSAFKNSNSPVQFATEKNQIIVISTDTASGTNGDVIGRITQRSNEGNEGSWQRWFGDQTVTVKNLDWGFNFHDENWEKIAESGGNEISFDAGKGNEIDEVGSRVSLTIRKDEAASDTWEQLTSSVSDTILAKIKIPNGESSEVSLAWSNVTYVEMEENTVAAQENSYRTAEQLWNEDSSRTYFHGKLEGDANTIFLGSVTVRDGFIVLRDNSWNEVARLIDPAADSNETSFTAMVSKYGAAFTQAWDELGDYLPSNFKDVDGNTAEKDFKYITDNWDNILVFSINGEMIGKIDYWSNSNEHDRSWDSEYSKEKHSNSNFNFQVVETSGDAWNWSNIGRYEERSNELYNASAATWEAQLGSTQVSQSVYERKISAEDWAAAKTKYDLPALSDSVKSALGFDWDTDVDRIQISTEDTTFYPVQWRKQIETEQSQRVEFFKEVSMDDGNWYQDIFLGSMEIRDGFIEIRDNDWETVARVADMSDASLIKDWAHIKENYQGIEKAWNNVKSFFVSDDLKDVDALKFTVDDNHIYAFTDGGVMIGQISYWSDSNTWTRYYDGQEVQIQNVNYNYNFHDADWNNLANSGGNERYITDPADTNNLILDEVGKNIGFRILKDDAGATWENYNPNDATGTITWSDVKEIRYETREWSSVTNKFRSENDNWSDSNVQIQYFEAVEGQDWNRFTGSIEIRDGFIEIRDEHWQTVAQLIDPSVDAATTTYAAMVTKYGASFTTAWEKMVSALPSEFNDYKGNDADTALKYTTDKWDNILIFDASGAMIGKTNYHTHIHEHDRSWDSDYPKERHTSENFDFQVVVKNAGNWNWMNIGRYEIRSNELYNAGKSTWESEQNSVQLSSTLYERKISAEDWAAAKTKYDLPALSDSVKSALGFDWDTDVDRIQISTEDTTFYPVQWRKQIETEQSQRVEFFKEVSMDDGNWYQDIFLGSMEIRDGFIEIRDNDWETVARVADMSDASLIKDWAHIKENYQGIEKAWNNVKSFFVSDDLKDVDALKFTVDDNHIYAFTDGGVMIGQISYWSDSNTWTRYYDGQEVQIQNVNYNYNFHDADWNNLANSGGNERYITDPADTNNLILDEVGKNIGFRILKDDAGATWENYNPNDATGTITWSDVKEIRYETREWSSVTNKFRSENDNWSDSNVQIQYFEAVEGQDWNRFTGSIEIRDGFIEIRDEHWQTVAQLIDPSVDAATTTYAAMVTKYGASFTTAWEKMVSALPSEFNDYKGNDADTALKYTTDKWDNILIFDASGAMIGKIGYWRHDETNDRPWDQEFTQERHSNENFNFEIVDKSGSYWNFKEVGRYEERSNEIYDKAGSKWEDERSSEQISLDYYEKDSSPEQWATLKAEYDLPALPTDLIDELGFDWASNVDQIRVMTATETWEAVAWRDQQQAETWTRIEYREEVPMNGGDWHEDQFLGAIEIQGGEISVINRFWDKIATIADPDSTKTFEELKSTNEHLDWAWQQVKDYLPTEAQNVSELSFTTGNDGQINAYKGAQLVLRVDSWTWIDSRDTVRDGKNLNENEVGTGFRFYDQDWNQIARAEKNLTHLIDQDKTEHLDRTWTKVAFTVYDDEVPEETWNDYDPSDRSGTVIWDEVDEISVGKTLNKTHENPFRNSDSTYENYRDRIDYKKEVIDGDQNWTEFLGTAEIEGNLKRIYNKDWEIVDTALHGDVQPARLKAFLDTTDAEMVTQYNSIISKYIDLDKAEIVVNSNGPDLIFEDGVLKALVNEHQNWENNQKELYTDYTIYDLNDNHLLRLGGWNEVGTPGDASTVKSKPNGVKISEFFYKTDTSQSEWDDLKTKYATDTLKIGDRDWSFEDIGIIEIETWKNDHDGDGEYSTYFNSRLIEVDAQTGRQNWDWDSNVRIKFEDGQEEIKVGNDTISISLSRNLDLREISSLDEFSVKFKPLIEVTEVFENRLLQSSDLVFKMDFAKDGSDDLFVFVEDDKGVETLGLRVYATSEEEINAWGHTEANFDFYTPDGWYLGWMWESNALAEDDLRGLPEGHKLKATNFFFDSGGPLDLKAWAYLNDVFAPRDGTYEAYDISKIGIRQEKAFNKDDTFLSKNILIQHHTDDPRSWEARIGYEVTNPSGIPLEIYWDGNDRESPPEAKQTSANTSTIEGNINKIYEQVFDHVPLPEDFYFIDAAPDANVDAYLNAGLLVAAEGYTDTLTLVSKGAAGEKFEWKVKDTQAELHEIVISSSEITDLGTKIAVYLAANPDIEFFDVIDDPDNLIFESVGEDSLSAGDGYTGDYTIAGTKVQSIDVEDVLASLEWEPITSNRGDPEDFLLFEVNDSDASGGAWVYSPDDAVGVTVTNLNPLVTAQKSKDDSLTTEEAFELALTDFLDETILSSEDQQIA